MPEILTMIQIKKLTPTPAVLCMVCVVSLLSLMRDVTFFIFMLH
jgi:hypothetical protein